MSTRIRFAAYTVVAAAAVTGALPAFASTPDRADVTTGSEHIAGHVLVHYRAGASHASQTAAEHAAGASRVAHVAGIDVEVLSVPAGQEAAARDSLQRSAAVETAELDGVAH